MMQGALLVLYQGTDASRFYSSQTNVKFLLKTLMTIFCDHILGLQLGHK